ncbi:hypothetical protein CEXT_133631 [Caerostris extrusa]|uniref:Secreted protein n=1 Tax=Caerostris extrusa TaxID=172846 RepID=A0AAV4T070_CAEEX|nr:hypothetical protein CEXT_133631 [Caerostris extrusa]
MAAVFQLHMFFYSQAVFFIVNLTGRYARKAHMNAAWGKIWVSNLTIRSQWTFPDKFLLPIVSGHNYSQGHLHIIGVKSPLIVPFVLLEIL